MTKEKIFIICRIIFVIMCFCFLTLIRENIKNDYDHANEIMKVSSLQVVKLSEGNMVGSPISDEDAIKNNGYVFKITNWGNSKKGFDIFLVDNLEKKNESLSYDNIRYQIKKDGVVVVMGNLEDSGYLYNDILESSSYSKYEIKFWIDENAKTDLSGKKFSSRIVVM